MCKVLDVIIKAHIMIIKKDKDYIIKIEKRHERYTNMIELKMHLFNRCSPYQRELKKRHSLDF